MTQQSASELISLPQGGGAIHGIGETFAPDLHTGTGNYRIPLELPPGRNGFQPKLALSYSTGNPNGPFGLGWVLEVPGVRRKTAKAIPRYQDDDVFVLSGAEDLVPVPGGTSGQRRYRPRTEGTFARIVHHTELEIVGDIELKSDFWRVSSKDGLRSQYGTPRPAGADPSWRDPAAICDPNNPAHVFAWLLTETVDPLGNRIEYAYTAGNPGEAQLYLSEIRYVDYGDRAQPNFLVSLRFNYEALPEPFSDRRPGFELRTGRRCAAIETWITTDQPVLARTVHLDYVEDPSSGVSLLSRVRIEGHDGTTSQSLPPLEFGYTGWDPRSRRYQPLVAPGGELPDLSLGHPDLELVDVYGEGLPGVLQMNGVARLWRNSGQGQLELPTSVPFAPPASLGQPGVQLVDFDGDGRPDLLVTDPAGSAGYYPLATDGGFDPRGFVRLRRAPSFQLTDPLFRWYDLDGSGVSGGLRTGAAMELFYNDPEEGFSAVQVRQRGADAPDVSFDDPRVRLADMTGDGLTDIVLLHDRHLEYRPYLGYGRWGPKVIMKNAPHFEDAGTYATTGYDPDRVLIGDVNGDGCADVVYVGSNQVTVWINRCGNGFAHPVVVDGTPAPNDLASVRLADMLGSGTPGLLWTYDLGTRRGANYLFLDLTGGTKPYLLASIDNHMGASTLIEYVSSTSHAIRDRKAGRPWRMTLPFPVQVVSRITVADHFSQSTLVSEFDYHHGHWDGAEREFRGFGRTDQRDALRFEPGRGPQPYSAPTELRTWFHLGPVGPEFGAWREVDLSDEYWPEDPPLLSPTDLTALPAGLPRRGLRDVVRALRGSVLRTELYGLDGRPEQDRPYTVVEHRYGVAAVLDGRSGDDPAWQAMPVTFPHPRGTRTTQWERGVEPMTQVSFTEGYDGYGRPNQTLQVAVPRGRDPRTAGVAGAPFLATAVRTEYATRDDDSRYMVDRVSTQERVELINDGSLSLLSLREAAMAGDLATSVRALSLTYYDGDPFQGLALGQLGDWGLAVRVESLALTPETLLAAYQGGDPAAPIPPYLPPPGGPAATWPGEYPAAFQSLTPAGAGYIYHAEDATYRAGWYVQSGRTRYDVQGDPAGRGLAITHRDPLGNDTAVAFDSPYQLLPVLVTDGARLPRSAAYDYRLLRPSLVIDANRNRTRVGYTPLGLVAWVAAMGKEASSEGDTPEQPGTWFEYDLNAWDTSLADVRQPISVHTTRRVEHRWKRVDAENQHWAAAGKPPLTDVEIAAMFPPDERELFPDRFLRKQEFSDGFGRLLQVRAQADDVVLDDLGLTANLDDTPATAVAHRVDPAAPPVVVVSGWQVYDNKGQVVEKYEPAFDLVSGWSYKPLAAGEKVVTQYDPRGLAVRTIHPDGSEKRVVPGIPSDLTNPDLYRPTPWESYAYDNNDNAGRTNPAASLSWSSHWNTPSSSVVDALGRMTTRTERTDTAELVTLTSYDIDGNVLEVKDPLGRTASRAVYDLGKRPWSRNLLDARSVRVVYDATGAEVESRDDKGALALAAYDNLRRGIRHWARDRVGGAVTLRQVIVYGDDVAGSGLTRDQAAGLNLLGRPYQAFDEAGLLQSDAHDLDGNLVAKKRQVLSTATLLSGLPVPGGAWSGTAYVVDWEPPTGQSLQQHAATLLDATFPISGTYDAIGRLTSLTCPGGTLTPTYDRAGALVRVELDGNTYVDRIIHNARGQRVLAVLGNRTMIRYVYDPQTFRLARLRSEPCKETQPLTWRPVGGSQTFQDHGYAYDLVGNLLMLLDRTPGCGVSPVLDRLDRAFTYDPIYRLLTATGRECDVPPPEPWSPSPRCVDLTRVRSYSETYQYDSVGNIEGLVHSAGAGSASSRDFTLQHGSNRLQTLTIGALDYPYAFDPCGNLASETTSRLFEWDHANRLATFRTQAAGAEPSVYAQYRYDASGQRVAKIVRNQGGQLALTVYVGGVFERLVLTDTNETTVHDSVHVMDGASRVAIVRIGSPVPGDASPDIAYHLGDQLGSSSVVLDGSGGFFNREEYTPYGETSFGSYARKRYRFTAKERDEESGLGYHGARYHASWLARWISCDPYGYVDGLNVYAFARNNPVRFTDPTGLQGDTPSLMSKPASNPADWTSRACGNDEPCVTILIEDTTRGWSHTATFPGEASQYPHYWESGSGQDLLGPAQHGVHFTRIGPLTPPPLVDAPELGLSPPPLVDAPGPFAPHATSVPTQQPAPFGAQERLPDTTSVEETQKAVKEYFRHRDELLRRMQIQYAVRAILTTAMEKISSWVGTVATICTLAGKACGVWGKVAEYISDIADLVNIGATVVYEGLDAGGGKGARTAANKAFRLGAKKYLEDRWTHNQPVPDKAVEVLGAIFDKAFGELIEKGSQGSLRRLIPEGANGPWLK